MRGFAIVLAVVCVVLIALGLGGCRAVKSGVLSVCESIAQFTGQFALTPAIQLEGVRSFGANHLEGCYRAEYDGFSGTEYVFGDTSTQARTVQVGMKLEAQEGAGTLFVLTGARRMQTLMVGPGVYTGTVELPAGGGYIGFTGEGLTGTLELKLTRS